MLQKPVISSGLMRFLARMQTYLTLFSCINRENFPWDYRDTDLNLLSVPPPFFDKNAVLSVHAAGDTKEQEENEAAEKYTRQWQELVENCITNRCKVKSACEPSGPSGRSLSRFL